MNKKYIVQPEPQEREDLGKLTSRGKGSARKLTHARILLQADVSEDGPGWTDERVTTRTVEHVRQRCVEQGLTRGPTARRKNRGMTKRESDSLLERPR